MKSGATAILCLLVAAFAAPAFADPVDVPKTNPQKVYMHYMPWFDTPATLGGNQWGWHWTMNNKNPNIVGPDGKRQIAAHYYPKIGPYDSSDSDVIEYHLLLMKLSGVDGVVLDWYGVQGSNGDIGSLLANSNALVDRVDDFGLDFGVVLEDRFSQNVGQAKANVEYLRDNYFNKPEYIRLGAAQDPLLMVFGPITFEQESDWSQILSTTEDVKFLPLWYESGDAGANADGEYAWIYEEENLDNHLTHQSNFYRFRAPGLDVAGGSAYPGFNDFYQEGNAGNPVPFEIPHNNGQTLDSLLDLAAAWDHNVDFLQLNTFNDFGEGTMFEPTLETGYDYLRQIQEYTGTPYDEDELEMVYRLYVARKKYAGDAARQELLDQVSEELAALEVNAALALLNSAAPLGDYNADGDVDGQDFLMWRGDFGELALQPGSQTILYGSGADGNFDGRIDAADYTIWRDSQAAFGGGSASASAVVPEPASLALLYWGIFSLWIYSRR